MLCSNWTLRFDLYIGIFCYCINLNYNVIPWWRHQAVHQVETFSVLLAICAGNRRWIPHTKASDAELGCFLWSGSEWWNLHLHLRPLDEICIYSFHELFIYLFISWNENIWISIKISLNFDPEGQINNMLTLVPIMAWRGPGDKPLSEPITVNLLKRICVTRPQWVKVWTTLARSCDIW